MEEGKATRGGKKELGSEWRLGMRQGMITRVNSMQGDDEERAHARWRRGRRRLGVRGGGRENEMIRIERRRRCSLQSTGGRDSGRNRQRGEESGKQTLEYGRVRSGIELGKDEYGNLAIHGIENLGSTDLAVAVVRSILGDSLTVIQTLNGFRRMKHGFDSVANNVSARTACDRKANSGHVDHITAQRCLIGPVSDSNEQMRRVQEFQAESNTQQLTAACGIPQGVSNLFFL